MSAGIVFKDILKAYFWKRDTLFYTTTLSRIFFNVKGTVMQIEKVLINNRLRDLKVSWKFCVPTICNFAIIYQWKLVFSYKVGYFLTVSIIFSVCKQKFTAQ